MSTGNVQVSKDAKSTADGKKKEAFGGKRGQRKASGVDLSAAQKFARREMQSARSALKQMLDSLAEGNDPPATAISACSAIKSAAGSMLFS